MSVFLIKYLLNINTLLTIVTWMPTAPTQTDHSTACVIRDTLEMESPAQVPGISNDLLFCSESFFMKLQEREHVITMSILVCKRQIFLWILGMLEKKE